MKLSEMTEDERFKKIGKLCEYYDSEILSIKKTMNKFPTLGGETLVSLQQKIDNYRLTLEVLRTQTC